MDDKEIKALSYVKSSKYRMRILRELENHIMTPSDLNKKIGLRLNHVSIYLKDLKDINLIICLNEENKKGRLYTITELGQKILQHIK